MKKDGHYGIVSNTKNPINKSSQNDLFNVANNRKSNGRNQSGLSDYNDTNTFGNSKSHVMVNT